MKKYQYTVGLLGCLAITPSYSSSLIEEVVVTSQKREQSLQEVPISVAAFDGGQLDALGVGEPNDIVKFIPNFKFQDRGASDTYVIRGIGLLDFGDANEAPVGFYVDEVYKATTGGQTVQLFDLERIEVLRGPQGTLFGRNTTGGLFHAITRKPSDEFEFDASVQGGSFGQHIIETAINVPFSDTIRGRLAYKYNRDEGYQKNRAPVGGRFGSIDAWALRGHLAIDLSEDVSLLLSGNISEQRGTPVLFNTDLVTGFPSNNFDSPDALTDDENDANDDTDLLDLSATLNWDISDNLTLTSITAFGRVERNYDERAGASPGGTGPLNSDRAIDAKQFTQELRLSGDSDGVSWVAGVYYFDDDKDDGVSNLANFPGFPIFNDYTQDAESWAVFAQADWQLSDALTLVTGIRYTEDEKDLDLTGSAGGAPVSAQPSIDTDNVTWRLGLDWQATDSTLLYANVSKGFKSGAFNTTTIADPRSTEPVGEEEVISYELGWKSRLSETTTFNGAFFYSDYSDLQATDVVNGASSVLTSVGDATIYGAEFDLKMSPVEALDLILAAGWLESEIDSDTPNFGVFDGGELRNTPQFTFSSIGVYTFDLGDQGSVAAQLAANWSDHYHVDEEATEPVFQSDFWLFDARVTWTSPDEKMSVALFGDNLTDEAYLTGGATFALGSVRSFGRPHAWGVKVSYSY